MLTLLSPRMCFNKWKLGCRRDFRNLDTGTLSCTASYGMGHNHLLVQQWGRQKALSVRVLLQDTPRTVCSVLAWQLFN